MINAVQTHMASHLVTRAVAARKMQQSCEAAAGTWGYSGPNKRQIIFCADVGQEAVLWDFLSRSKMWFALGRGVYKNGDPEPCFLMNIDDFDRGLPAIRPMIKNQESVLRLGYLKSQNRRSAELLYINGRDNLPHLPSVQHVTPEKNARLCENIGTFLEVTKEEALAHTGYSLFSNHYFTVIKNPVRCEADKKQRATTQAMADAYVELARRNAKYASKHGCWRKRTQKVQALLLKQLHGAILENGSVIDGDWFQEVLKANNVH